MKHIESETTAAASSLDYILNFRRAVRHFTDESVPDDIVRRSVQRATLAPSSGNMQFWEFYRVKNPEKKEAFARLCLSQPAALNAKEIMVVVARRDLYRQRSKMILEKMLAQTDEHEAPHIVKAKLRYGKTYPLYYMMDPLGIKGIFTKLFLRIKRLFQPGVLTGSKCDLRVTTHKNVALAAQTFMLSMAAEGYDSCPMEGFDGPRIRKFLQLPGGAEVNMVIAMGKRDGQKGITPRMRIPLEEVYREI